MLISILAQQPQMLPTILQHTPVWVWGMLAALIALGLSQVRDRTAGLPRVALLPVAMISLSIWGAVTAFGQSPLFGNVMLAWAAAAAIAFVGVVSLGVPRGAAYDAGTRTFALPGSWLPLVLILAVFLTRYVVNVDVAMNPALARDGSYTLVAATLYGLFSGVFAGRAARLWLLVRRTAAAVPAQAVATNA